MSDTPTVYQGVWFDHGSGLPVLTLSSTPAGILSAALVTWVHFVAGASWPILRYVLWRSTKKQAKKHDVYDLQQRILLRNSNNAESTGIQLSFLMLSWRRFNCWFLWRYLPYSLICSLYFVLWTLAALYVPAISRNSVTNMLLVASSRCGLYQTIIPEPITPVQSLLYEKMLHSQVQLYMQQCYNTTASNSACWAYPSRFLSFTARRHAACPAGKEELCLTNNSTVMELDSGFINSNVALGINAPIVEQVNYRHIAKCSPIDLQPFLTKINALKAPGPLRNPRAGELYSYRLGSDMGGPEGSSPFFFNVSTVEGHFLASYVLTVVPGLQLPDTRFIRFNTTLFNGSDCDPTLIIMKSGWMNHVDPVYDPFFSATDFSAPYYQPDYVATALLCTEQHQICSADNSSQCTPLVPIIELNGTSKAMKDQSFNEMQIATVTRIFHALLWANLAAAIGTQNTALLLASKTVCASLQWDHLPKNQWEIEFQYWFAISLTKVQNLIQQFATGSDTPDVQKHIHPPSNPALSKQCKQQLTGTVPGYTNFDFTTVIIILTVGIILIPFGLFFDRFLFWVGQKLHVQGIQNQQKEWVADGIFQVQRSALEAAGVQEWTRTNDTVPITHQSIDTTSGSKENES